MIAANTAAAYTVCRSGWREHLDLELLDLLDARGKPIARVPVVDGWLQLDAVVKRVPDADEERVLFAQFAALRDARGGGDWFFVHKPPGLRMRFKLGDDRTHEVSVILECISGCRPAWLGNLTFGSFFAQAELLDARYRATVDAILGAAANELIDVAMARNGSTSIDAWANFALHFLEHFIGDRWFAWEALGRFHRLRSQPVPGDLQNQAEAARQRTMHDPRGIIQRFTRHSAMQQSAGFGASIALLQTLNYIFNMWAVDGIAQNAVLARARTFSAPELTRR
jgi:hypothetical protein